MFSKGRFAIKKINEKYFKLVDLSYQNLWILTMTWIVSSVFINSVSFHDNLQEINFKYSLLTNI